MSDNTPPDSLDGDESGGLDNFTPPPGATPISGAATNPTKTESVKADKDTPAAEAKPVPAPVVKPTSSGSGFRFPTVGRILWLFVTYGLVLVAAVILSLRIITYSNKNAAQNGGGITPLFSGASVQQVPLDTVVGAVKQAKKSVFVVAAQTRSKAFLNALIEVKRSGKTVLVILGPPQQNSAYQYLAAQKTSDGKPLFSSNELLVDPQPFTHNYLIMDQSFLVTGSLPFTTDYQKLPGDLLVIQTPSVIKEYMERTQAHYLKFFPQSK